MYNKEFRTHGIIDSKGNLKIYKQGELKEFTNSKKDHKIIITVNVLGTESSKAIVNYFKNYIIPEFRRAIAHKDGEILSLEATEEYISNLCSLLKNEYWDDEAKQWITEQIKFEDLDNYQSVHCLTDLKQTASMEYNFEIKDDWF